MNKNMNFEIGMPKSGVEVMRERLFGAELQRDTRVDYELPESATVEREDNFTERMLRPARDLVGKKAEQRWRANGLRSLVLMDQDAMFKADVAKHAELGHLTADKVRADKAGFNMLLGGEVSRVVANGDVYGALRSTIAAMPEEQRVSAEGRMRQCAKESDAKALLGELWAGLVTTDYTEQRAEAEKKAAEMKAAQAELQGVLENDWLQAVMEGHADIPWQVRNVANMERAGLSAEYIEDLRATHHRAKDAFAKLVYWLYGDTYGQVKANMAARGRELKKDWEESAHWAWTEKPSDEDFAQQGAADLSESFDLSREHMAELIKLLSDESGQLDENAVALFFGAVEKEAKGAQTLIDSKFWRNFGEALGDFGRESADFLDRELTRQKSTGWVVTGGLLPMPVSDGEQAEAQRRMAEEFTGDVEVLKGNLTRFDQLRVQADERAGLLTDILPEGGTVTGASVPMLAVNTLIPGFGGVMAGAATMYPSLTNEAIAYNYAAGVKNPVGMAYIEGAWQAAVEGMFGAVLGKIPGTGKLLDWGARKTMLVPGVGKTLGAIQGNAVLRIGTGIALESAGELVVEEVVAETGTFLTVEGLRRLGVDFAEQEWKPFENAWKMMQDAGQTGATVAYCAALGLLGVPANMKAARDFAGSRKMLLQVGLTEEGIKEVQQAHTAHMVRVNEALQNAQERLAQVRAEAGEKAVQEAQKGAKKPLLDAVAEKIRVEAGERAVAAEVEKIRDENSGELRETMREVYHRDVIEDPTATKKRMEKRGEEFLKDVEVELYARSGVLQYVLEEEKVVVGDRSDKGLYKVQLPGNKEGEVHEVEWTEQQLMAYVAMQRESGVVKRMREFQAKVAGTALAEAAKGADVHAELVNLRELPMRALARMERNGGRVDYAVMQDLAEDARERISGFVSAGMSFGDAAMQMSEVPGVTLGTLAGTADAFVQRIEELAGTAEGEVLGIKTVNDAQTHAFRVRSTVSAGQSVLLFNRGLANERELVEDLIESDVVAAVEGENATVSWQALEGLLRRVEGELMKHGGGRLFKKGVKANAQTITEAFSTLGQSYFLLNHGRYDMSAEAHHSIEYVQKKLTEAQHLVALSHAWDAFAKSKEGKAYLKKEGASLEKLLSDAGASVAGLYDRARFEADAFYAVREAYEASVLPSPKLAEEVLGRYEAEQKELDNPEPEGEAVVVEASASITGEALRLEPESAIDAQTGDFVPPAGAEPVQDDMRGKGLKDGLYVPMADGSVYGAAAVDSIELSADVPQFKKKESAAGRVEADADGTTHELAGGWNENSAPIHVWRRVDGRLEVISGRHRLAHAKKNGVQFIAVRVYDEAAGHDAAWAKLHDVEQNILDNTCNAVDVAYYFRHNPMSMGEAEARGLMPKTKQGEQTAASRMGLTVALQASENTFALLVNGKCTAEDAYMACVIATTEDGQQLALEAREGKAGKKNGWEYVTALVRGAEQMQSADGGGMLDLFGNDDSFRERSEKMARYVAAVRAGIKARLNVLQSAGRLNKKGAVSKELGVKVKTPKDAAKLIARLAVLDAAYERLDPDLGIPARVDAWDGKSAVPTKLEELAGNSSFSLAGNLTPEMEEIKAAAVADGTFMKAPNGKPSNLNEHQWLQVRTTAFKDWFGDWENDAENASKAVDENGEPKVYYHHTNALFTEFLHDKKGKTDAGWLGSGFYFYGIEDEGKGYGMNVMECFLNVREPYYASDDDMFRLSEADSIEESEAFTESLIEDGYDGVYYDGDLRQEMMVFEPDQIKSATDNRGTFDGSNADITFSVIGPKAKTWDKYKHRAFTGRDDGMQRAEIDASQAKLKWEDLRGKNVAAYRRIVDDWYKLPDEECKVIEAYAELYYDWQDELSKLNSTSEEDAAYFEVYRAVAKLRTELNEKRDGVRKLLGKWFVERGGGAAVMVNADNALVDEIAGSLWGPYMDGKVADELDLQPLWHGGMALQDVLEYDELYEAYPELAQLRVETVKMEGARGRVLSSDGQHIIQINKNLEGEWAQFYSVLMHEIQHVIQDIEGFAKGGNPQSARDAAGNYKRRYEIQNECARLRQNIAWLEGYDVARREFLNIGDAISMREDKEKLQDLRDKYNNLAYQYNKGAIVEPGYNGEDGRDSSFVIPSLSGVTKGAYAKAQKAWDITQDRKAAFPGMLERLRARYDVLWAEFSELDKQQQRWGALSSHELYLRLAGEIEARNVQSRVRMSADERLTRPFNETLEYPGEALVTFSLAGNAAVVRVTAEEAPADKAALVHVLKNLTGQKFTNKAKQMSATVSVESAKKIARAEQETVANLTRLGYTEEEAGMVHRAAAVKIGELYERAELYIEEEVYHKTDDRKAAWHFFEPVTVELNGREETFLTNISVVEYTYGSERIFSLELTIENPISDAEGRAAPASGRPALHPNGVSNVRVAAFQSFVKKEKTNLERKAREKGLIPWRADEARLNELRGEAAKVQKEIDALLAKFGGDETKLKNYRRDRIKLYELREQLAKKQALIAAEYKPEGMPDVSKPKAPNGKDSNLPLDLWLTVRTKAFKAWFGDWEKDPANASKVVDENGEPKVVYHGTNRGEFRVFSTSNQWGYGAAYFANNRAVADVFAAHSMRRADSKVYEVFVNLRNPLEIEADNARYFAIPRPEVMGQGDSTVDTQQVAAFARDNGYDGVIVRDVNESEIITDDVLAFEPNQIKSATDNRGTFDGGNADITFSVIGPKAKTWDKYKHRAFTGRDDGMQRAEIDASGAKLKAYSYSQDSTVVIPRFRAFIGFVRSSIRQHGRMQAVTDDWTGKQPSIDSYDEVLFIRRALEKIGVKFKSLGELVDSGVLEAVLSPTNANIGAFLKKTEWQPEGMSGYAKLEDVLDYPELYEAYPQLRQVPVLWQKEPKYRGLTAISQTTGDVWVNMNEGLAPERMRSTLLHEVQHVIQFIEGYAAGTFDFGELRGWMSDNGYLEQALTMDNRELYSRLAGEIESRNVQMRQDWTMDERLAKPFNETLEYPGEAITVRAKNLGTPEARFMGDGGVTFSMAAVTAEWADTLERFRVMPPKAGTAPYVRDLYVCPTPAVMQMVGAKGWDIVMAPRVVVKCLHADTVLGNGMKLMEYYAGQEHWHDIALDVMKQLPAALADPICITVSDTPGCIEVVTELKEGAKNILVAVQLDAEKSGKRNQKVNRIASLYGKDEIKRLLEHPRLYWNNTKARFWTGGQGLQLPVTPYPKRASARRVLTPADLVKYKMQTGLSFSLSGPDMVNVADTGRMAGEDKMQRLLKHAHKEAARWMRTFGKELPAAKAAELMGSVSSIMGAIYKELPPKYRPRLEGHMRWVEVYARLLESGKVRAYGKLSKEQRAAVEAELLEALRADKERAEAEYERAKKEALDAAELTGEMVALEAATEMDVADEVKRRAYLDRLAKRTMNETRKRLLAEAEAKKKQLDAEIAGLTRDFAAEKLAGVAKRMLNEAANAVEQYLIDEELGMVEYLQERLAPRKLPNGKYDKGRMSADAYRKLVKYVQMIETDGEEVAKQLEKLGTLIAAEEAKSDDEAPDGEVLDALQAELAEWSTYGNLREKCLDAVRKGVAALREFAVYEKNAWSGFLQLQRNRAKRIALRAADALGGADEFKVKEESEKSSKLKQRLADLGAGLQSIGQMFYGLAGVPELRGLVDESLDALSAGHVALTLREKRAYEQLAEYMKRMGLDTENKRNNWMAALKKKHNTGIMREGILVRHRLKLTPEEAEMWLSMTKGEREVKRAELEADADKKEVLVENVPYEEDIPLLREALAEFRAESEGKKWVHTYREFRKDAPKEPMVLSKDEAMNILLLCEQGDYLDAAHDNGYTDEVLEQLGAFVGDEVMSFGYAMRGILEGNGLAEVYEAREGVPFPAVKNYWPGNFDQSARVNEQANALDPTSGNGTRYGMLITRVKHKLRFNILGATNVFMAALAQQNNYIVMGELTAKWRRLLSHNDFAMSLKQYMGVAQFKQFKELIELLDGAGVQESITQQTLSGVLGQFQSAHAMAVLAGSPITLVKQVSAMINAGAWEGISMGRVLARIVLDRFDKGAIRYRDMLKKDYFRARCKDNRYFTEMMQLGRDANWSKLSKWARTGMGWIEKMDVLTNCAGMTALYNITYHDLKYRNDGAADPLTEEEMHAECDRVVRNALELGAQPLRRTQKSAFAALSRNALVKMTCYMGSEAINKVGVALSLRKRTGGGIKGFLKAWKYLAGVSLAQQIIVMALDMARNADPIDDDEWAEWALLNLATGASGLGIMQAIPLLGEAVQKLTGGYAKTGSLGQMIYDYEGAGRAFLKLMELVTFDAEDFVQIKKTRKSDYWQVTYKKFDGSRVTVSTGVPVDGGLFDGEELSKEDAELKALEVGKVIANADSPGWADWGMVGGNMLRVGTAFTGAWKGINSTSKAMSELSGLLQSLNAMVNTVRPFMQAERNAETGKKEYSRKVEKEFREVRKETNAQLKAKREQEKAKKREKMLKNM